MYLDLSTVFSVSSLWVDLDLSNDFNLSYLLLLVVSTILLDARDFSVLLTMSIFFFAIGGVMAYFTTLGFVLLFFYHVSIPLFENCVSSIDQCLFGFI